MLTLLLYAICAFLVGLMLIVLSNWRALRNLGAFPLPAIWPRVSILLPARDEAGNIVACVRSLLAQDYPSFEVLVLDDESLDGTGALVAGLAKRDARLRLLRGRPLPTGWLGKHWACHQLAEVATGEVWLFTDADTLHQPGTLQAAVAALLAQRADLLTGLPRQVMGTWGERLIVSILPWSVLCFYPLALAERWPWPPLVTAVGQFMLFRRDAYERLGGHAAVRSHIADDVALAQRLVAGRGIWRLLDLDGFVTCRMYAGLGPAFRGFSKSLFAAFGYQAAPFAAIWLWLAVVFVAPPLLLALSLLGWGAAAALSLLATGLALGLWALAIARLHLPPVLLLAYPFSVALAAAIALHSLVTTATGRAAWKGRQLAVRR